MLRLAALCVLVLCSSVVAEEVNVQVLRDGQPAKGAVVRVAYTHFNAGEITHDLSVPLNVDDEGKTTLKLADKYVTFTVYANDAGGLFAVSRSLAKMYAPLPDVVRLELAKPATCSGRFVDSKGQPITGLELTFRGAKVAKPVNREEEVFKYYRLDPLEASKTKTDEQGRYSFGLVPAGMHVMAEFRSEKHGRGSVRLDSQANKDVVLADAGSLKFEFDDPTVKASGWNYHLQQDKEDSVELGTVTGFHILKPEKDQASFTNIVPGTYRFNPSRENASKRCPDWPKTVEIKAGVPTVLKIKTTEAATLTGKLVDKETGKGLPETRIAIQGLQAQFFESVTTNKDGVYTAFVPGNNKYTLYLDSVLRSGERFYELPKLDPKLRRVFSGFVPDVLVQEGQIHEFPTLDFREALTITGKVERTDKKPFSGPCSILFSVVNVHDHVHFPKWDGNSFKFAGFPNDTSITLRVKQGNAVNVPEKIAAEKLKEGVTYTISENNAVTINGSIVDQSERGVPGVKVELHWSRSTEGQTAFSGSSSQIESTTTNAKGEYVFRGMWPNERYFVRATDPRFGTAGGDFNSTKSAGPGKMLDFGSYTVKVPEHAITGTVLHLDGTPVAGATVQTTGDTPKTMTATTDEKGKFEIKNVPGTRLFVTATKTGYRHTYTMCDTTKATPANLTLRKQSEDPAPMKDEELQAKRSNATHEMLELVWVTRANHNWGPSAYGYAIRFDEKLAKKWIDEAPPKEAEGLKAQLNANINNADLVAMAKKDIDDTISKLKKQPYSADYRMCQLGEKLVSTDKELSRKLAEAALAVLRAQKQTHKGRYGASLSRVAALLHLAGQKEEAKKLFSEALDLVAESEKDAKDEFSLSWVAEQLGKADLPAALEQFKKVKEEGYHNRALANLLVFLAKSNPQQAIDNLKQMKFGGTYIDGPETIRVAVEIADRETEKALKLIDELKDATQRAHGYMELAKLLYRKNQTLAWSLIDKAFDAMEKGQDDFRRTSNFGGRPAAAAQVASVARQIGHPDVHSLVARTLTFRVKEMYDTVDTLDRGLHYFLMGLSIADPEAVRFMLQGKYKEDDLLRMSTGGQRNLLFILAMVDPALCKKAVELYMASIKKPGFGQSGILEMLGSLTTKGEEFESLGYWQALFYTKLERE
jgi:Carboxypeptidase regulatory-like domain